MDETTVEGRQWCAQCWLAGRGRFRIDGPGGCERCGRTLEGSVPGPCVLMPGLTPPAPERMADLWDWTHDARTRELVEQLETSKQAHLLACQEKARAESERDAAQAGVEHWRKLAEERERLRESAQTAINMQTMRVGKLRVAIEEHLRTHCPHAGAGGYHCCDVTAPLRAALRGDGQ